MGESVGTFCDSKMMGWDTDELEENMAVILDDDSPIGKPNPTYEEALQAFKDRQAKAAAAAAQKEAGETKGGKKDKKKKGKKAEADDDDDDFEAPLADFKAPEAETAAAKEEAPEPAKAEEAVDAKTLANRKKKEKK